MDDEFVKNLKALRDMGAKSATFEGDRLTSVEFFQAAPVVSDFGRLDSDTIVPPAPEEGEPAPSIPAAMRRVLQRGSVS